MCLGCGGEDGPWGLQKLRRDHLALVAVLDSPQMGHWGTALVALAGQFLPLTRTLLVASISTTPPSSPAPRLPPGQQAGSLTQH